MNSKLVLGATVLALALVACGGKTEAPAAPAADSAMAPAAPAAPAADAAAPAAAPAADAAAPAAAPATGEQKDSK